ncbi:MAG: thioredoxin domain-containing protein [Planctomycetes bacterium]|nr:thioredoxin domain-containing protein [Planctomycetota bacterium]
MAKLPPDGGPDFNRLIFESSPYLLQHARNPVDWYAWGAEAFERARREEKLVFLSVGYSTCHWCHVMERESFENEAIARLMNDNFVSIKVDREERPDVDAIYMAAVQALTGSGGWPMSVFLTADGKPIWGGTYFPPDDRFGQPGFRTVLQKIADLWRTDRARLERGAEELTGHIRAQSAEARTGEAELTTKTLEKGYSNYTERFDAAHGGFGGAPKFPRSHSLSFLLRYHSRTGTARALEMVETTLQAMAAGGMYDHLGGGFHRYSTDPVWLVPHFEQMLNDQALLARTYVEAYQVTGEERYAEVARDMLRYVLRDMTDASGGFYSAEDADSEGVEGKFYLWTEQEILRLLGREDGTLFARVYGVTQDGNYREEASGGETGENILHLPAPVAEVAADLDLDQAPFEERLEVMRRKLFEARERRVHPHRDDKILTDWNGLMIWALAYAGRVLGEPAYVERARRAAEFLLGTMQSEGRLLHRYREGNASIPAFLDDHAFLSLGLFELYQATFEARWLGEARRLCREMVKLFWDGERGGFRLVGEGGEQLITETKELYDGAIPSGNSAATLALSVVGRLTMDGDLERHAEQNLKFFAGQIDPFPMGYPFMLMALDFALGPSKEVVLAGDPTAPDLIAMRRALDRGFFPNMVVALHPPGDGAREIEEIIGFLEGQDALEGNATAYVCENYACNLPTTDPVEMLRLLRGNR